jgi:hypothetical protein
MTSTEQWAVHGDQGIHSLEFNGGGPIAEKLAVFDISSVLNATQSQIGPTIGQLLEAHTSLECIDDEGNRYQRTEAPRRYRFAVFVNAGGDEGTAATLDNDQALLDTKAAIVTGLGHWKVPCLVLISVAPNSPYRLPNKDLLNFFTKTFNGNTVLDLECSFCAGPEPTDQQPATDEADLRVKTFAKATGLSYMTVAQFMDPESQGPMPSAYL